MQKKLEGKMISYYNTDYQCFVYLGCCKDDPATALSNGRQTFNPEKIKGCLNALGPNSQKLKMISIVTQGPPLQPEDLKA